MNDLELLEAMRLGGRSPASARAPGDLGRFGLGLKTASFSQCRRLTVATRRNGQNIEVRRWDLDHVTSAARDWHLLKGSAAGSEHLLASVEGTPSGTLILWEMLDRLTGGDLGDEFSERVFLEAIDRVEEHLAMVFHRFLEGALPALRLFVNGTDEHHRVKPWDPFMPDHPATIRRPVERIPTRAGIVEVQGFVLPHKDWLTPEANELAGGPSGWTAQQGFYVYRNRRMLVSGSWLGLGSAKRWTKEEAHKLARLRLDISNAADEDWNIDIKKSVARPPQYLRARLLALAADARQMARQVFAHRGSYGARPPEPEVKRAWVAIEKKGGVQYRIDRDHPAIRHACELAGMESPTIEAMLRVIEETVPVQKIWLDTTEKGELLAGSFASGQVAEIEQVLAIVYRNLRNRVGLSATIARAQLLQTEPFNCFPELVSALPDEPGS